MHLCSRGEGAWGGVAVATAPVTGAALESSGLVQWPDRHSGASLPQALEGASVFLCPEEEGSGLEHEAVRAGHPSHLWAPSFPHAPRGTYLRLRVPSK